MHARRDRARLWRKTYCATPSLPPKQAFAKTNRVAEHFAHLPLGFIWIPWHHPMFRGRPSVMHHAIALEEGVVDECQLLTNRQAEHLPLRRVAVERLTHGTRIAVGMVVALSLEQRLLDRAELRRVHRLQIRERDRRLLWRVLVVHELKQRERAAIGQVDAMSGARSWVRSTTVWRTRGDVGAYT